MDSTKDKIIENNYIFREIIYIKEKSIPENIEILQDIAVIHEIKDIKSKSKPNLQKVIVSEPKSEVDIKLEGEKANRTIEENIEEKEIVFENDQINNLIECIFNKLNSNEIKAFNKLLSTKTVEEATESFMKNFERPSKKEMDDSREKRYKHANSLLI